jgi:serine/threonine protein kinase
MAIYIPSNSPKRQDCEALHKLRKEERLGIGAYGSVYQACKRGSDDCGYVIKVMSFNYESYVMSGRTKKSLEETWEDWDNEVEVFRLLNEKQQELDLKFAPILYDSWYCLDGRNGYFYILMEKYDGDLSHLLKRISPEIREDIKEARLKYMYLALNFIHHTCRVCLNDIKLQNILYKQTGPHSYDFVFADFGKATLYSNDECIEIDRKRFKRLIDIELS